MIGTLVFNGYRVAGGYRGVQGCRVGTRTQRGIPWVQGYKVVTGAYRGL